MFARCVVGVADGHRGMQDLRSRVFEVQLETAGAGRNGSGLQGNIQIVVIMRVEQAKAATAFAVSFPDS